MYPSALISKLKIEKLSDLLERSLLWAYAHYLLEIFVFLAVLFFGFYWSFAYQFPMGYSGLYSLMAEGITQNHFLPPASISFYGPGKIPFSYPPLGFYLNAFLVTSLGIEQLTFLKFFAPLVGILTAAAVYLLSRQLTSNRLVASTACLLFLTTSDYLNLHIKSDGMVRGPALLFALLGIYFYSHPRQGKTSFTKYLFFAGLFLGLSFLTHLSYGVFCVLSIFLLGGWKTRNLKRWVFEFVAVVAIAMVVSSPWWLLTVRRYGLAPFISAINSHSTVPALLPGSSAASAPGAADNSLFAKLLLYPVFYILGLPYWLMKRDWKKATWGLCTGLFVGESVRFMAFLTAIALAELCFDLARYSIQTQEKLKKTFLPAFWAVLLALALVISIRYDDFLLSDRPFLTDGVVKAGQWLRVNTEPNAKYLFITRDMNGANEWMPYLARRTPVLGHWGAEWLGDYYKKHEIMSRASRCAEKDSWTCLQRVVQNYTSRPDYLVFFRAEFEHLEPEINTSGAWVVVFQDTEMIIYQDLR